MDRQHDIFDIGAGNGGLSAATSSYNRGFKPLLIEKHNLPGGFAASTRQRAVLNADGGMRTA